MSEKSLLARLDQIERDIKEIKQLLLGQNSSSGRSDVTEPDQLLTVKELAKLLQITPQAVYAQCADGKLPFIKLGKSYKFKKSDILPLDTQPTSSRKPLAVDDYVDRYLQNNPLQG